MCPRRFLLYLWPFRAPARVTFYASIFCVASGSGDRRTSIPHFGQLSPYPSRVERAPHSTTHGTRADLQTAGLNGVFAHFCRRGQKWVAPGREMALLRPQARKSIAAAWGAPPCERAAGDAGSRDACKRDRRGDVKRAGLCPALSGSESGGTLSGSAPGHILSQNSGASGVLRYSRGLPSASTSTHMPPELPEA